MNLSGSGKKGFAFLRTGIILCCLVLMVNIALAAETEPQKLVYLPAYRLAGMILSGEVTSVQALEAYLDQISRYNEKINAVVTLDIEGAMLRARQADEALARGEVWGPLHGVPVTIKDNYATKGLLTTVGYPGLAEYVPDFDATVVARVRQAGAVIIGKTNLPQLAMDYQTCNPVFGATNNPWDLSRTPGGSTGGGAAAVASFMSALSFGNDLGGSIRIPSHFCGIYGIKPTENLVSKYGINPGFPKAEYDSVHHLISCGPLARSIEDLKLCLRVIAGPDRKDEDVPDIPMLEPQKRDLGSLRIAWMDDFGGIPVSQDTRNALKKFTKSLADKGCTVERTAPDDFNPEEIWDTYGRIMDMELGVYTPSWARFVSFLFGGSYRKEVPFLRLVFPIKYEKYMTALTRRDSQVSSLEGFLAEWDVWLCPVTTTPAYRHIKPDRYFGPYPLYDDPIMVDEEPVNYLMANGAYTTVFNLTGSPVVVIPIGSTGEGLPIGVQIVGKRWHDMELLEIAAMLDDAAGAYRRPPGY
ncbi:MAG TPA: amidase [Deltaproteobacteria bacterium]|nr:amidase [Deltaproteobacteria bacterium]